MSKQRIIDYEKYLEKFKKEFLVESIYKGAPRISFQVLERPLTHEEKKDVVNTFLEVFYADFFNSSKSNYPNFFGGTIKLVKVQNKDGYDCEIKWISESKRKNVANIKMSFKNVESNLIYNLTSQYMAANDITLLDDI